MKLALHESSNPEAWYRAASLDLFFAAYLYAAEHSDFLQANGIIPPGNVHAVEKWGVRLHEEFRTNPALVYEFFFKMRILIPILLRDWGIDRNEACVSQMLGIRSLTGLQDVLAERVQGPLIHLHLGPGDGSLMEELSVKKAPPGMRQWHQFGIGDRLYFSLEKMVRQYVKDPDDTNAAEFIRIFSQFVTAEFRERMGTGLDLGTWSDVVSLKEVWNILREAPDWISKYYNAVKNRCRVSDEFEDDAELIVADRTAAWFDRIINREGLPALYEEVFRPEFVNDIFSEEPVIDLYRAISVNIRGFIFGKFQSLTAHFSPLTGDPLDNQQRIALMHGDRSDSHLSDKDFMRCLGFDLSLLKQGGVYISDGIRQSYTRIMRLQKVAELMDDCKGRFRAFAVVDKATQFPLSAFIEKGIYREKEYEFMADEKLAAIFDFTKVELVSVQEVARRTDIVVENAFRRRRLHEAGGHYEVFRYLKETRTKLLEVLKEMGAPKHLETFDESTPFVQDAIQVLSHQYHSMTGKKSPSEI